MQNFFNLVMLVCATLASMGIGVFVAYGIFRCGFALMRWHTGQKEPVAMQHSTEVARVS